MRSLRKNVFWILVFLLIIQIYVSSEVFWVFGFGLCIYEIIRSKDYFYIPFAEYKLLFVFIPWGLALGFIGFSQGTISTRDIVRDVFYYMNPLIFLFVGSSFAKRNVNLYHILNAFIIASAVICFIQFTQIMGSFGGSESANSVYGWRKQVGDGHVVTGVALAVTLAKIIPVAYRIPKSVTIVATFISLSYFVISMSRTNILIVLILYMVLLFQRHNKKRVFSKIFGLVLGITVVILLANMILPPKIINAFSSKMSDSLSEVSSSQSWASVNEIQSNWRGYETYCALSQWENESPFKQFFGSGFGKRIFVGEYAYSLLGQFDETGGRANSIAVLHNGYASQLVKLGIFGVFAYIVFYVLVIRKALQHMKNQDTLEARLLLSVGLVFLLQTYFLNGLFKDYVFLPTVLIIGYTAYKVERKTDYIEF